LAVGVILYELWKRQQPQQAGFVADQNSNIPVWAQQLSASASAQGGAGGSVFNTDIMGGDDMITSLLSLPQGPGGTVNVTNNTGYFSGAKCLIPQALTPSVGIFA
jgi:hypothetical protein